jgi:hypothetical protein
MAQIANVTATAVTAGVVMLIGILAITGVP